MVSSAAMSIVSGRGILHCQVILVESFMEGADLVQ